MRNLFVTKPELVPMDELKILHNVGALMDLHTGFYVRGMRGENIINGGHGALVAVVGKPNTFKTTIAHHMTLTAASHFASSGYAPYINTYDTEVNMHASRLRYFANRFSEFGGVDLIDEKMWLITDASKHLGDEWFKILRAYLRNEKIKNAKKYTVATPFMGRDGKPIEVMLPTFGQVDSLTKFVTSEVDEIQNKYRIGEGGGQTIYMRAGNGKARLLMEMPVLCNAGAHYTIVTAHVGQDAGIIGAPQHMQPTRKLQHMRQGEKVKGVPDDFLFLTNSLWQTISTTMCVIKDTKAVMYPRTRAQDGEVSKDLNIVTIKLLRNKSGLSGNSIDLVVSQSEGVLPSLSEFHHLKEKDRFGLEGNNTTYRLTLRPSVTLSRTTVRELLDNDPMLRRAVKITADIHQIKELYKELPLAIPTMSELYDKLQKQYGWDLLLNTRDYWTFDQYEHKVPYLSTLDILEMYHDLYVPYWLK